ncbi:MULTISPECIES: hypothetical protein [Devosia]|uniref:hypothetical protein n=1 Tax=Devosia TaxID=46913 RepID=UPI000CE9A795|nr:MULTISPECIES: hypothetical protein [Devosia]AVF05006.1 hypothetical protein C4375_15720 [Devosia sp. I507]
MEDYELLELALQLVIPREDTKALGKTPLPECGSLSAMFNASETRLARINGLGPTSIPSQGHPSGGRPIWARLYRP